MFPILPAIGFRSDLPNRAAGCGEDLHTTATFLLSSSWLRFLGRYSYALYVIHQPLLFFKPGALPLDGVLMIFASFLLRKLVFMACAAAVSVALAVISSHLYERQFLELKSLFPYEPL
jgi:peptidoglycan/LPS O-acetylase OafA/YrhL